MDSGELRKPIPVAIGEGKVECGFENIHIESQLLVYKYEGKDAEEINEWRELRVFEKEKKWG